MFVCKPGRVVLLCNPVTWEVEAGGPGVPDQHEYIVRLSEKTEKTNDWGCSSVLA
jgi:hypothetical protein